MSTTKVAVTDEDLDYVLSGSVCIQRRPPRAPMQAPRTPWVERAQAMKADEEFHIDTLLELVAETPDGTLEAIRTLLAGLHDMHEHDDVTCAALAAIEHLHLPNLVESFELETAE